MLDLWQKVKKAERHQKTQAEVLRSVTRSLPALMRAEKVQKRAADVGFDWESAQAAFYKIGEEAEELRARQKRLRHRGGGRRPALCRGQRAAPFEARPGDRPQPRHRQIHRPLRKNGREHTCRRQTARRYDPRRDGRILGARKIVGKCPSLAGISRMGANF